MTSKKDISEYYDNLYKEFESKDLNRPNLRHRKILKDLKNYGLQKSSTALEIGCGSAVLTNLISQQLSTGKVVGVDISPETIEYAKLKYASKTNMEFFTSDMDDFQYDHKFDFIIFPDVLEHIPIKEHSKIFRNIKKQCHDNTIIYINIPEPNYLEWVAENAPDLLQIIDQPLHINTFSQAIYENNFFVESIESYSLWMDENDYQTLIVKPKIVKNISRKSKWKIFLKRIQYRFFS
jgi:trans-aconitate 2-methyltransferase